jgi:rubrerythrin
MYPAFVATAQSQGEKSAETYFQYALAAEKVHEGIYRAAREAVGAGRDIEFKAIHVCPVCGFTMEGDAPDKCPLCGTPKGKFVGF